MKDEDTGVDPVAKDGEPNGKGDVANLDAARGKRGRSIEERAEAGEGDLPDLGTEEEGDGQFAFVSEGDGKRITFGTFIPKGVPVEYKITMGSKSNVLRGKPLDPQDDVYMLVRGVIADGNVRFTRDENEKIVKATIYMVIAPRSVINAHTEQAQVMLHGEPAGAAAGS